MYDKKNCHLTCMNDECDETLEFKSLELCSYTITDVPHYQCSSHGCTLGLCDFLLICDYLKQQRPKQKVISYMEMRTDQIKRELREKVMI